MAEGGSTITQQLARNVYLSQAKTIKRKIHEVALAILIERNYSKDEILGLYLNRVYYGSGSFGVEAASRIYFGKNVEKLNLSECALLAGLPKKPSGYSPHVNFEAAINRRDVVLNRMAELGYISAEDRDEAKSTRVRIAKRKLGRSVYRASHFVDYVSAQIRSRYGEDA